MKQEWVRFGLNWPKEGSFLDDNHGMPTPPWGCFAGSIRFSIMHHKFTGMHVAECMSFVPAAIQSLVNPPRRP